MWRNQKSNCQHLLDHRNKKRIPEKSASLTMLKPLTVLITTNWKILKDMGKPDHCTCLLRNLYAGQQGAVRTGHEIMTGSKLRKVSIKTVYCPLAYLTYMQSTSSKMLGWMTHSWTQDRWEKYQQPQICRWYHFNGRKWRGTKEPFDEF